MSLISSLIFSLVLVASHAQLPDLGAPGYACDPAVTAPSETKPTSVHALRPADIDLVMAMGDSLTAGFCVDDVGGCRQEYRGLSWGGGGDRTLDTHITIPNILLTYNPNLFGQSHGIGGAGTYNVSYLNMAISGMRANNLPTQAQNLINTFKAHPEIDIQNTWKLLNIFIGYNDLCNCGGNQCWCKDPVTFSPANYSQHISDALNLIRTNIPKVLVNLVQMNQLGVFDQAADQVCSAGHCGDCSGFTQDQLAQVMVEYQQAEKALEQSGAFDTTDDFTLVVQPWYTNATLPLFPNGTVNREFWAADCYHYSSYGNGLLSTFWWQNMLQPVGEKSTNANMSAPALPLECPLHNCPFIRTTKNSANCQQFGGTCISDGDTCTQSADCCSAFCFGGKCQ